MRSPGKAAPLAAALIVLSAAAADDEPDIGRLKAPQSEASLGAGHVSSDNARFGQYSGLKDEGGVLLLDADVVRREDASGIWTRFGARNLGLDSRELGFGQERQGDWRYVIDFSQIPRFDPYAVNSGLQGIGTTKQTPTTIVRGSGAEHRLETERRRWTVGGAKSLAPGLSAQVVFRSEDKEGDRLFGQGTFGNWRFLAEPIDQRTEQIDATLAYNADRLQLAGGYYGTRFRNRNEVLNVVGTALFAGSNQIALPPDNQSHQLHLSGGYSFTPTTRAMFKVALGRITQDEAFPTAPLAAGAPASLDARIDTTLLQAGLTTRPLPGLSLRADLRYEDRDDRTPVFRYYPTQNVANSTNNGENEPRDIRTRSGKLDATYRLPLALRLGGGVEVVEKTRNSPPVRSVGFRETTDETTYHVSLRRSIGESASGALTVLHSERTGSEFLVNVLNGGALYSNAVAPLHLADRDRDTLRVVLNWAPTEPLSLNIRCDLSQDRYTGRKDTGFELGPRKGEQQFLSLDGAYTFSERLQATAWVSRTVSRYENALCPESGTPLTCTNTSAAPVWGSKLGNFDTSFGLGVRAQPIGPLKVGADFVQSRVRDEMSLLAISPSASAAIDAASLPDSTTRVRTLRLYADYALRRQTGIRAQLVQDRYTTDDWTWASWAYSDGTTVTQDGNQLVSFVGAALYHRF
ncbi:MAG TPA: MtrB/PioB family decaheme-associated outer membrane protein [Burkholderiales bacterium]